MSTDTLRLILNIFTALCGAGGLGLILKYKLGTKKLDLDSEEAIRDHYAKEVARLTAKLDSETRRFQETVFSIEKHYREMLADSDRRHEECQKDRRVMADRINALEQHQKGLEDQIRQYSTDRLMVLENRGRPSEAAPEALAAAKRLKENGDK